VAQIDATATTTGVYTVVVGTLVSNGTRSGAGTYQLILAHTPEMFVVPSGDDGGPLTNGANQTGSIQQGDLDLWSFSATAGDAISVSIGELTDANGQFWPWIRLRAPNGNQLGFSSGDVAAQINVTAPTTGLYTVVVGTIVSNGVRSGAGTYQLVLTNVP
jgi:hypothetical protein